ncbi:hypothetical protein LSAT2_007811 [Lamellibrachia satsuma]|nr:hypothetical protein LSAT2_007811 [Lamellibrachia satsuma]
MAKSVASFRNGPAGYLHTGDNSDVVSQRPMHNVKYENTYRSEPAVDFPYLGARAIIRDVLQTTFAETTKYDPLTVSQLASDAANELKNRVKELRCPRFKLVTFLTVGQESACSLSMASRCAWNDKFDTYAESSYRNGSIYAIGIVFGVYVE